jgi:hypothetical protein
VSAQIIDFDRAGRLERRAERRKQAGYGEPAAPPPGVDQQVATGMQRAPWGDVEDWIRRQANPRLRGAPTKDHLYRAAEDLRRIAAWVDEAAVPLAEQLKQAGKGYPRGAGDGSGIRGEAELTSVEAAASAPPDPDEVLATVAAAFIKAVSLIVSCQRRLGSGMAQAADDLHEDRDLPTGAGRCQACNEFCSGSRNDRLRLGLCPRCEVSWRGWLKRYPEATRPEWTAARRQRLAAEAAAMAARRGADDAEDWGGRHLAAHQDRHGRGRWKDAA